MFNDVLLYRAERIKNGQNVHRLNNLLTVYVVAPDLAAMAGVSEAVRREFAACRRSLLRMMIDAEHSQWAGRRVEHAT